MCEIAAVFFFHHIYGEFSPYLHLARSGPEACGARSGWSAGPERTERRKRQEGSERKRRERKVRKRKEEGRKKQKRKGGNGRKSKVCSWFDKIAILLR